MDFKRLFKLGCGRGRKDSFVKSVECGQFTLDFYYDEEDAENCKVEIRCGVQMDVVLKASHNGYGFLMSCYHDGALMPMEAYCGMLWQCSHLLATDSYFPKRVGQSWQKYMRGLEKEARDAAVSVTKEQDAADEALMREAVRIADMSDEERAKFHGDVVSRLDAATADADADEKNVKQ